MAKRRSPAARAESFSMHELIDPRDTRAMLCRWVKWIRPLLPDLLGPRGFPIRA